MLYAIGAGSQVVGVDKYSTYPPNAPRTKFTGYESSAEDYLYLRPDLVIFAFETGTLIQQLRVLHIPALLLPPATGMAGVDSQLAGARDGHRPRGRSRQEAQSSLASLPVYQGRTVPGARDGARLITSRSTRPITPPPRKPLSGRSFLCSGCAISPTPPATARRTRRSPPSTS